MKAKLIIFAMTFLFFQVQAHNQPVQESLTPEQAALIIAELKKRGVDIDALVALQDKGRNGAPAIVVIDNTNGASGQANAMAQRMEPVKQKEPDMIDQGMKYIQFIQMLLWLARMCGVPLPF